MAKLKDKLYNRIIEGKLTIQEGDELEGLTPKYEVGSVESLSSKQIESLKAGDIVVKKTGNQRHAYIVSYKENGQGICLTYTDASCVETVSYDKSGDNWVFNSKDVTLISELKDKPNRYSVTDIRNIPQNILSKIKGGDIVVSGEQVYICFDLLQEDSLYLAYCDVYSIEEIVYSYDTTNSQWVFGDAHSVMFDSLPINFAENTHSFNNLAPSIKQIVDNAIADDFTDGVACTSQQWNNIKNLLDKSLYLYYDGFSMIKTMSNGINSYMFGFYDVDTPSESICLYLSYAENDNLLFAKVKQV